MLTRAVATVAVIALAAGPVTAGRVVAIAPLSTLGTEDTSESSKQLTAELEKTVASLPDTTIIGATAVADAVKKSKKAALKACEGEPACEAEVGKLVGATIVVAGEVGGLGDAKVVYLRATDVATAKEMRSTTLTVGGAADDAGGTAGAVMRLLAPDRYLGTVHFSIDVTGATVYVNGTKATLSAKGDVALPVGTQAVRVTQPEYHDFVRFIAVQYGRTTDVPVGMQQYPIVERDLAGKPVSKDQVVYVDPPLYRRWYVWGGVALGVAVIAGVVAGYAASRLPDADECTRIGGGACSGK